MGRKRKYPAISVHKTIQGTLEVDWDREYKGEFTCPECKIQKITQYHINKGSICKLSVKCKRCGKRTNLTNKIHKAGYKHFPISKHKTLNGILEVNWSLSYKEEYKCPECNQSQITDYEYSDNKACKLVLLCNFCGTSTSLTSRVPAYTYKYCPEIECPNPLCQDIGHNGQKGWIYLISKKEHKCRFCKTCFNINSNSPNSWVKGQTEEKLLLFSFNENTWQLANFYKKPKNKNLHFTQTHPTWYLNKVKKYLLYLLKAQAYVDSEIVNIKNCLQQFGKSIIDMKVESSSDIKRNTITHFLDSCKKNSSHTINLKLSKLKNFFDWLDLDTPLVIRSRDFSKVHRDDPDWLDEITRNGIEQHLDKIPAPIVRHYLVQLYTAARPSDICLLAFDCLIEENGKWYIKFFQQKTNRWHRLLANRKIRKIIEEQQQWIKQAIGEDYPYLFCHFRSIRKLSYPTFPNIKPLPKSPISQPNQNPMVRIIRMLIEKENILDANGQKPHFTGKITRHSRLQEVRTKYGMEAAQLYADHKYSKTTFQHYAPPTREQIAEVDLPFQGLLLNLDNKFLPWQSLPESLLSNPKAHELDIEIAPRLVVYGHCALDPKTPCPINLFPKCYGCSSFRPSTGKLSLYERQYEGEQQRLAEAENVGAELAFEEAKATITAMDKWLPELRKLAHD